MTTQFFVTREMFNKLVAVADPTWQTFLSLARLGGLRCPSEVLSLKWTDINWEQGTVTIHSPKTECHPGRGKRTIPLYGDGLRQALSEAHERAPTHAEYVVDPKLRQQVVKGGHWRNVSLHSRVARLCEKAGLEKWPRLLTNLRSSRETELLERCPVHVVAQWQDHSAKMSLDHYAQVTPEHFQQARTWSLESGAESGATEAKPMAQKAARRMHADERDTARKRSQPVGESPDNASMGATSRQLARMSNGGSGIRTHGEV